MMSRILFNVFIISCTGSSLYGMVLLAQKVFCKRWTAKRQFQLLQWNYLFYMIPFTFVLKLVSKYQEIKKDVLVILERIVIHNVSLDNLQERFKFSQILFGLWSVGILFIWINQVKKEKELEQFIEETSIPITKGVVIEALQDVKEKIDCKEEILCYENPYLEAPILIGDRYKKLILPMEEEKKEDYYLVLLHEIVHVKRGDIKKRRRVQRLKAILWFQPVIYLYAKSYNHWSELACDEEVMNLITRKQQKRYIELIVQMIERKIDQIAVSAVSFRGTDAELEQRVARMIRVYKEDIKVVSYKRVSFVFFVLTAFSVCMNFFVFEKAEQYHLIFEENMYEEQQKKMKE